MGKQRLNVGIPAPLCSYNHAPPPPHIGAPRGADISPGAQAPPPPCLLAPLDEVRRTAGPDFPPIVPGTQSQVPPHRGSIAP
ncbi:uncharacterized protein SCHCODRAFT_02610595 [Schizophyllum commune H4-8]|uniref:uncharacterized protein n=1 Tax=Schizophyllum commune (strain H4-8 / FGSC 9210) TaxID=578458 RepID=UPI00215DEE8A|nr:uncharacterized protein SCHCODRAFT_02610595 [Schizophyllum commune H4-8]KAI5897913.1 hypothetical protein SCHCODRAFT_02610595 [Schizophyllum commune H4-8]